MSFFKVEKSKWIALASTTKLIALIKLMKLGDRFS